MMPDLMLEGIVKQKQFTRCPSESVLSNAKPRSFGRDQAEMGTDAAVVRACVRLDDGAWCQPREFDCGDNTFRLVADCQLD